MGEVLRWPGLGPGGGELNVGRLKGEGWCASAGFAAEIGLQLDDGGAPGHVDAPAVVGEVALVLQLAGRGAEAFPQQFRDGAAQRLVSPPRGHRSDDLGQAVPTPTVHHMSPHISARTVAGPEPKAWAATMSYNQSDLFAQDDAERDKLSEPQRSKIRSRLQATPAKLEATQAFPWHDPLDAVHEENLFQHEAEMLGEKGLHLWPRFDKGMDRLHSTRSCLDARAAGSSN